MPNLSIPRVAQNATLALLMASVPALVVRAATAADSELPDAPVYTVQPCCSLCPRAAEPDAYETTYMKSAMLLAAGDDGWLFRTNMDLVEDVQPIDPLIYEDLARLRRALNARGVQVVMVSSPPRGLVEARKLGKGLSSRFDFPRALDNYRKHLDRLRAAGFIVPDTATFAGESADNGEPFYFKRDVHWRSSGARRTAELVAAELRARGLSKNLPEKPFDTVLSGTHLTPGSISAIASRLCGGVWPSEISPTYITAAPSSDNLFGDEGAPQVTLVGTSFSANPLYHFAGYLQSTLKTDVLNAAVAGGSFDGALTQYLRSAAFQESPPKILIWETAYQYFGTIGRTTLRRLIPLVGNGCTAKKALKEATSKVNSGLGEPVELIYNGGDRLDATPAKDLVLDLQFDNPAVKDISVEFWYLDGSSEMLHPRYNEFTNTEGRVALELSPDGPNATLPVVSVRLRIATPLATAATVTARLCRAGAS